jgi:hypothetical protein
LVFFVVPHTISHKKGLERQNSCKPLQMVLRGLLFRSFSGWRRPLRRLRVGFGERDADYRVELERLPKTAAWWRMQSKFFLIKLVRRIVAYFTIRFWRNPQMAPGVSIVGFVPVCRARGKSLLYLRGTT